MERSRKLVSPALCALSLVLFLTACGAPPPQASTGASCAVSPDLPATLCRRVEALKLPDSLPPARGNDVAENSDAALLGFEIFYDARFSGNANVRCATCHKPEADFGDALPLSQGMGTTARNAPTILDAAWNRWQFWDGRADSLWSQPLYPTENPAEMGFTRLGVAHLLARAFPDAYAKVFGPLPDLSDATRFPAAGRPGDPDWDQMATADQDTVNLIFANYGKALEAYMRKIAAGPAPLDAFLAGDRKALSPEAQRGLVVFAESGCLKCHSGPTLSDHGFHDLGVPQPPGSPADPGRDAGRILLARSIFNDHGPYYDGPAPQDPPAPGDGRPADEGAFRTPSLRNVALSAPYGHDGVFDTLEAVVDFHLKGGAGAQVDPLLEPHALSDADRAALLTFLREGLTGRYPDPPWNNWPDR